jgi:sarcosine oxidase, subunit beta
MSQTADAVVIGGGIQGCSTALQLARLGMRVILLEKDSVGRHASGVNAGGVRRLLRHEAEIPLSVASMEMWHGIRELLGGRETGFAISGQVAVAETQAEWDGLRRRAARVAELGFAHEELLEREELYEVLPALAPHCVGGLISRTDGFASLYHTSIAFRDAAVAAGAIVQEGVAARDIERRGTVWHVATPAGEIRAGAVVNCAGAWAAAIAARFGEPVPLEPIAPMMMVTARLPHFVSPVVLGTGRKLSLKQASNGTVLIGGGHRGVPDTESGTSSTDFRKLITSARTVSALFPIMSGAVLVRAWSGIESRLPDDIPVIGPSSTEPGLFHAFGFSAHGFQLGPIIGVIMANLVVSGATQHPIAPFAITRFTH